MSTISYFSHDSNARNSAKLIKLRMGLGLEGYAIYFMILERLREAKDYKSSTDYDMLAFDFRTDSEKVKKVVEDYSLFSLSEGYDFFWSKSFDERMTLKDEKNKRLSEAGKRGAKKRWQSKADSHPNSQGIGANGKKRKEKKSKEKYIYSRLSVTGLRH